jgi:hypothetical protein
VALACSVPWGERTAGFGGTSDGLRDLTQHKRLTKTYDRADGGNVVLTGRIEYPADGEFLLTLGVDQDPDTAALNARAAILDSFDKLWPAANRFVSGRRTSNWNSPLAQDPTPIRKFIGRIDELTLWNVALDEQELLKIHGPTPLNKMPHDPSASKLGSQRRFPNRRKELT